MPRFRPILKKILFPEWWIVLLSVPAATAMINVVKYRKYNSPVMSAAKALHFVAALVSMLALETAMLTQFGSSGTAGFRKAMTGCTGGVICALISGLSVCMIRRATKQIRKMEETT